MNDEDVSKTDSLIESFVDNWIVSGILSVAYHDLL